MESEFHKSKYKLSYIIVFISASLPYVMLKLQGAMPTKLDGQYVSLFDFPYFQLIQLNIPKFICWFIFTKTTFFTPSIRIIKSMILSTVLELLADLLMLISMIALQSYFILMIFPIKSLFSIAIFKRQFKYKLSCHHYVALSISFFGVLFGILFWLYIKGYIFPMKCKSQNSCNEPYFILMVLASCLLYSVANYLQEKHKKCYGSPYLEIVGIKGLISATILAVLYPTLTLLSTSSSVSRISIKTRQLYDDGTYSLDNITIFSENFGKLIEMFVSPPVFSENAWRIRLILWITTILTILSYIVYYLSINSLISKGIKYTGIQITESIKSLLVFALYYICYYACEQQLYSKYLQNNNDLSNHLYYKDWGSLAIIVFLVFVSQLFCILIYSEKIHWFRKEGVRGSLIEPYQKPRLQMYDALIYAPKESVIIEQGNENDEITSESYVEVDDSES